MAMRSPAPLSPEWHELRRHGIGASEVAAICDMSSFASPIDIWEEKRGLREARPETTQMEWGRRLEDVVAGAFAERTGISIRRRSREVRYQEWPVLFAHIDRMTPAGPLEVKTAMSTRGWGEDGSSEVPTHVGLQVQAQLLCADRPRGFVAALIGYRDLRIFEIERQDELLQESVLPILHDFWERVETGTPPVADGSESYGAFLRRLYPSDSGTERPATPEEGLLVRRLLGIRHEREVIEKREAELTQAVQLAIAEDGGLLGPGWRITFRRSKETDWQAVAAECDAPADLVAANTRTDWRTVAKTLRPRKQLVETHSTLTGSRRFHVSEEEES